LPRSLTFSLIASIWGAIFLPVDVFKGIEGHILTFSGVIVASVIPTMALMATVLRAGRRSVREVTMLGRALMAQFDFWVGVLVIGLLLSALLLLGATFGWKTITFTASFRGVLFPFDPIQLVNGLILGCSVLLWSKFKPFVEGFRSLLELHVEQVVEEAKERFEDDTAEATRNVLTKPNDPSFGEMVKH